MPLVKRKVTSSDICLFSRQLATMVSAGVPLVQSFDIVAKSVDNGTLRNLLLSIKSEVERGHAFSEVLKGYPRYFNPLFCHLVCAGEISGSLDTMLDRIATYLEKTQSLKRKIKKALFYPCAVIIVAIAVTTILLIFVVPQFEYLFKGFGSDLPAFTKMVLAFSKFMQRFWWVILAVLIITGWILSYSFKKYPIVKMTYDKLLLKIPVIGILLQKTAIARFARTLSTTFAAGVPLVLALESAAGTCGNILYANAILKIREDVSTGSQIHMAMRNTGIFPNRVLQMIAIGEGSGSLDTMLSKVASIFEEEVDSTVLGLSSLLEPLIMAILGVLVGSLVIAMYLPLFKMGEVI